MKNLVDISAFDVLFDLRYASKNNVCGVQMYAKPIYLLHKDAAKKMQEAIEIAALKNLKFKIFDAFRPMQVQKFMHEKFSGDFVSNPQSGSVPHCRGVAVDLTLVDCNGKELEMGSDFDEFSELAFHDCSKISDQAKKNRRTLFDIMQQAGFDFYSKEWWHYQLFDARKYEIIAGDDLSLV